MAPTATVQFPHTERTPKRANANVFFVPGFAGDARFVGTLSADGQTVRSDSMLSPFAGDNIFALNHPTRRLHQWEWEEELFRSWLNRLVELRLTHLPTFFIGLSRGGQIAYHFTYWYNRLPEDEQVLASLDTVLFSTFLSPRELRRSFRRGIEMLRGYEGGPVFRWLLRHGAWRMVAKKSDRLRLAQSGRDELIPLWEASAKASVWMLAAMSEIAAFRAFGRPLRVRPGDRILSIQLDPKQDEVVQVEAAQAAIRMAIPDVREPYYLAEGGHHGVPEVYGPGYLCILKAIRDHRVRPTQI